ncbi:MAG: glycine cleavage T C-terminal barrel domain-containing protein [Caldilineaceae bacterium]
MTNEQSLRLLIDGRPIDFVADDSALIALLRSGEHPTGGGCLCLAGDCAHCVATVDGVAYVRTCQVPARPGMMIERHPADGYPPLPLADIAGPAIATLHRHCDVVVIGQGAAGQAAAQTAQVAGREVITLDARNGEEVIGIYPGPLVVARTDQGMVHLHPRDEIVVATGTAEIQPVAPGNHLAGIVTARAATQLTVAGIPLGRVVAVGSPPAAVAGVEVAPGELVRFEGTDHVEAVVVRDEQGQEQRIACDTVTVGLGFHPRDALRRMGHGLPVRAVGDAARDSDIPPCPLAGVVCACSGVTVEDLEFIWEQGFTELELVKRATLAGTGTCQGSACLPHIRSFLATRGETLQPPFTARPVTRQLTIGEVAAGAHHHATPRTALDGEHRRLGAQMERVGGWWRPWRYTKPLEEYWAIREAVSVGDVSTLGKLVVSGPDALELLERLYPTKVATIKPGRARYVLLLDEKGYVLDDGLISCDDATHYTLTFTSGGATMAELWVRDWAEAWGLDVRLLNQTLSVGAINVTGPLANDLLTRAGLTVLPTYMAHRQATVAGVPCRIYRLSFTGELSYELHHAAADSVQLWRTLLALGADLGIKPHGIETLLKCRLEKGHIIVGQDTDYDSTPRRIRHEWAVKLDKANFVGKQAVLRTNKIPLDRQLVGLEMEGPAPHEGAVIRHGDAYAGYVTSSTFSPLLGKSVMLGWLEFFGDALPDDITIDGRPARRAALPFYDLEGNRARANDLRLSTSTLLAAPLPSMPTSLAIPGTQFQRMPVTRIVATPAALEGAQWPEGALALRTAPDEVLVTAPVAADAVADPYAILVSDTGFAGMWLPMDAALAFLARECAWALPTARPAFAQGAIADLPVKCWFEQERVLFLVPAPYASDLEERMA